MSSHFKLPKLRGYLGGAPLTDAETAGVWLITSGPWSEEAEARIHAIKAIAIARQPQEKSNGR